MQTVHPTLLMGPSDWDEKRMPRSEFADRIAALFVRFQDAERAIVFGNSRHHAELAYFTNLIPKLGPALASLSREGAYRMFVGDAANMLGAARPLTFIENLASMKEAAAAIAAGKSQRSLLVGADYMPMALRATITEAAGTETRNATAQVWRQMARKSRCELDAIAEAKKLAAAAGEEIRQALGWGAGPSKAVLAGERAANEAGAQDVRMLVSVDGGRTLRPFMVGVERPADPLLVYLAVRRFNYWAEGFHTYSRQPLTTEIAEKAHRAMKQAATTIKPGAPTREIAEVIASGIAPYQPHPVTARAWVQRMGLALDEPPYTDIGETFEEGEVYSLRVGAMDGSAGGYICAGMLRVTASGVEIFNPSLESLS
jgi:Metallopeptidase family M24